MGSTGSVSSWEEALLIAMVQYKVFLSSPFLTDCLSSL